MNKKNKILILVLIIISFVTVASAQVNNQYWKLLSNVLQPVIDSYGLKVPSLGGSGTKCIHVDNDGLFSTASADCSSGAGGGLFASTTADIQSGYFVGTGNVGIGTSTPTSKLTVSSDSIGETANDIYGLLIENTTFADGTNDQFSPPLRQCGQGWAASITTSQADCIKWEVQPIAGGLNSSLAYILSTKIGSAAYQARLAVESSGDVGISTSTPSARLHVVNTGSGSSFLVEDSTSQDATPFIIDANGNVGIGTTSPYAKLAVVGQVVAEYFTATTTATSTLPFASSTAYQVNNLMVGSNLRITDPQAGFFDGSRITALTNSLSIIVPSSNARVRFPGSTGAATTDVGLAYAPTSRQLEFSAAANLGWSSDTQAEGTKDTGIARDAAGGIRISNGSTGGGYLKADYITATSTTPSTFAGSATFDNGIVTIGADGVGVNINDPSGTYALYGTTGDYFYTFADQDSGIGLYLTENSTGRKVNLLNTSAQLATFLGSGNFGISTSSPYAKLSVVGETVASHFTATTTAFSTFPNQKTTRIDAVDSTGTTYYSSDGDPVLRTGNLGGDTVEVIAGLTVGANATITGLMQSGTASSTSASTTNLTTNNNLMVRNRFAVGTTTPITKFNVATTEHSSAVTSDIALFDSAGREVVGLAAWSGGGGATGYGSGVFSGHCAGANCRLGELGGKNTVNTHRLANIIFETNTAADNGRTYLLNGVGAGAFRYAWYCIHDGRCSMNGGNSTAVISTPTAVLHLRAGTTAAGYAPLKFNSGSLLTTAEAGAVEFLTDKWYATITTGAARKELTLNDIALTSGRVPYTTTNGRLTDTSTFTFTGTNLGIGTSTPYAALSVVGQVVASHFTATSTTATSTYKGGVVFEKAVKLAQFTVATLPTCNAGSRGSIGYVTDASGPTYLTALTGGGAVVTPAFCDGTNWVAH